MTVKRKRAVVCGATGFIGRNLAEILVKNDRYEVVGVYHKRPPYELPGIEWIRADLTSPEDVDRAVSGADILIQAAATTSGSKDVIERPYIHTTDNAVMNSLMLRAAFEQRVGHLVFFSCTVMYHSSDTPLAEEDFNANQSVHPRYFAAASTKLYIEKMCEFYAGLGRTRHTVVRHSNVYGPHDKFDLERSHVFGATVTKVMTAKDDKIIVWGAGEEARDLLYIGDLVDFVQCSVERQTTPFALYNVGTGNAITVKDLVRKIVAASGRKLAIEHDLSKPTIPTRLSLNCRKAERELGWRPRTMLDKGITHTLEWWQDNLAQIHTAAVPENRYGRD